MPKATSRVWHGSPVWFVGETPVVGHNVVAKGGVALVFWNGRAFGDPALEPVGKFNAARVRFTEVSQIKATSLRRWLRKAATELLEVDSIRERRKPAMRVGDRRARTRGEPKAASIIRCAATLQSPRRPAARAASWTFLILPTEASAKLPSRGMTSVEGSLNGSPFRATLEPDGQGGHWLKVERKLREAARAEAGDVVTLEIEPVAEEPEPKVPADLRKALAGAPIKVRETWSGITPIARRDWVQWITSGKRAETRVSRIGKACDMLAKGKRRPCCFDRSGMYDKSLSCPVADDESSARGAEAPRNLPGELRRERFLDRIPEDDTRRKAK
jgi:hypothetical protein